MYRGMETIKAFSKQFTTFAIGASLTASLSLSSSITKGFESAREGDKRTTRKKDDLNTEEYMDLEAIQLTLSKKMKRHSPEVRAALAIRIETLSRGLGFTPGFLLSVIEAESHYRSSVVSFAGAVGLMQVMPATAQFIARHAGIKSYRGAKDLLDPVMNVTLGAHYLAYLRTRYPGYRELMMAYNAGPNKLSTILKNRTPATTEQSEGPISRYASQVMNGAARIASEARVIKALQPGKKKREVLAWECAWLKDGV